jgi:hypothetical protein
MQFELKPTVESEAAMAAVEPVDELDEPAFSAASTVEAITPGDPLLFSVKLAMATVRQPAASILCSLASPQLTYSTICV